MNQTVFFDQLEHILTTLSNPLKLKIYLKILGEGCECDITRQTGFQGNCVSSVMQELQLPQSTASMYIADLKQAGLIECQKNGKFVYCKATKEPLIVVKSFIDGLLMKLGEPV